MAIPNQFGNPSPGDEKLSAAVDPDAALVSWVVSRVRHGREQRDVKYATRWEEYTRLWRGFWDNTDKNTDSERSKLISPALQQAVEMTAAEIEEAIFGKEAWFEVDDDLNDPEQADVVVARDNLIDDFDKAGVENSISQVVLLGAIYGTGIGKINVGEVISATYDPNLATAKLSKDFQVSLSAVRPDEFVIDPSATTTDEALFCAHEFVKPRHTVLEKQLSGVYLNRSPVSRFTGEKKGSPDGLGRTASFSPDDDAVFLTEYCGKVPVKFLSGASVEDIIDSDGEELVEAIVVVANETTLLKAVPNPFIMKDRPFIAYQHDTVPGEFWGRGICEKGYNPQKALDAELRARIDALALMTAPMMGADITRLPRNPDLKVRPGRTVYTRGRPSEIYEPVVFGNPSQLHASFQQSGDLERMVQMGTGAMDAMTPLGVSRRNETAGGMSMMLAGALKRTKRTMQNLERQFLNPLIKKSIWRYIQFAPERYPADYNFVVRSTMGLMAKEVENQQLVQMLGFTPPESPAHKIIIKALFDNTASSEKQALNAAIEQLLQPPSEEELQRQQQIAELQLRVATAEAEQAEAEAAKTKAEAELAQAKTQLTMVQADLEDDKVAIQAVNAAAAQRKAQGDLAVKHEANVVKRETAKSKSTTK